MTIDAEGPGRWRIRSWEWRGDAWRPAIARAVASGAGIEISGSIGVTDRAEAIARLRS